MIPRLLSNVLEQGGPKEMKISKKLVVLAMVLTVQATQKASARKGNPLAPVTGIISNTIYLVQKESMHGPYLVTSRTLLLSF